MVGEGLSKTLLQLIDIMEASLWVWESSNTSIAASTEAPPLKLTSPWTSPVKVIIWSLVNLEAVSAFPSKFAFILPSVVLTGMVSGVFSKSVL